MLQTICIKQEDYVYLKKISRAKHPTYDPNKSELMRNCRDDRGKYEIDKTLTDFGVAYLIESLQTGMKHRFRRAIRTADWRKHTFGDGVTYPILENQTLSMTVTDTGDELQFSINRKWTATKQTLTRFRVWYCEMGVELIRNRKPLYADGKRIDTEEELKALFNE